MILVVVMVSLLSAPGSVHSATGPILPELPRQYVDTTYVPPSGKTIVVPAGGNFQAALNAAQAGDAITLEAGATFTGTYTLPNKQGTGWITIRTSAPDGSLPPQGSRVDPSYANAMPKLVAGSGPVIATAPGAHHYRFIGIEIRPRKGAFLYSLVLLGSHERAVGRLPHHIIFDRCYMHADPTVGGRLGVSMDSASTAVINSYLAGFKETCCDAQAIWSWNGTGPFKIVNNYLEASGESVMFGGTDPVILNLVPSDIEIRGNHFAKPMSWRVGDPAYEGTAWRVKNLFELKNAQRVLVDGNIFEYNWVQADQQGYAIGFTVRDQSGTAPWSVVQDVTFTHNIVRHSTAGILILGWDYTYPSQQLQRMLIQNNLFLDIGAFPTGPRTGYLLGTVNGPANIVIDHNTAIQTAYPVFAEVSIPSKARQPGFVFTNNLMPNNGGVSGDYSTGNPLLTLSTYFPGVVFAGNVLAGGNPASYPPGNFFPATLREVGFVNYAGGDYHLAASSRYKHAGTDGKDIGADIDALSEAIPSWGRPTPRP